MCSSPSRSPNGISASYCRTAAPPLDDPRRVRDREPGEVELVRAVLRRRGPVRDRQAPSDNGMPASARSGVAASAHVVHGARTDVLVTDDDVVAVVPQGHGEVVLVVLEPAVDHARRGRDEADAAAVATVRESAWVG